MQPLEKMPVTFSLLLFTIVLILIFIKKSLTTIQALSNSFTMRTCFLSFVLALAAWNTAHSDMTNPLSIKLMDDPCSFSICLVNGGSKPIQFLNSFEKDQSKKGVPAFTVLYIRDREGHILSKIPGSTKDFGDGYTWLIFQSEFLPDFPLSLLKPKESLNVQYSLKRLALGLFDKTLAKRESANSYQMKIYTKVFLDKEMKKFLEAETNWTKIPPCLLEK